MRRLWAYIITIFASLVLFGTTFANIALNLRSNLEYENGKELVFRIDQKDDDDEEGFLNYDAVNEIADEMKSRLDTSNVTKYEVETVGYDTIKVRFNDSENSGHYDMISKFLTFNATLALTTSNDKVVRMEDFRSSKEAYVTDKDSTPQLVLPVNTENEEFKALINEAKSQLDKAKEEQSENDEENQEAPSVSIYLWYDFVEDVDSYEASQSDAEMAKKILLSFDIANYNITDDVYDTELITTVAPTAQSVAGVKEAFYRANYYKNLVNSSELNYKVTYLYSQNVSPLTENLINFGNVHETVAMSRTLIASLVSIGVVALLLVALYKLSALSAITTTIASVYGAFGFLVLIGLEFNMATIIGIIAVGLVSLASTVVYNTKLHEEAYRGRSLKKANSEAAKRALLPIVDINVVAIVLGAFLFILGGVAMRGLSAALVIGGLISLIANTLVLRGLMWMLTNTTKLTGKYEYLGIDSKKVPNIVNEEKQTYFGPFADRKFTKIKKPVGIASCVLLIASFAGMITFGLLNKGNFYNQGKSTIQNSEIYFEAINNEYAFTNTSIKDILKDMIVYEEGKGEDQLKSLESHMKGDVYIPSTYTETIREEGVENEYIHYFYVVTLDAKYDINTKIYDKTVGLTSLGDVDSVISARLSDSDLTNCTVSLKVVNSVTPDRPGFASVTLATFVGVAVLSVYFMLRYRLSRGLTTLLVTSSVGAITIGIFSLTRMVISTYALSILPAIAIVSLIFEIFLMNREKELIIEDRSGDKSVEARNVLMEQGTSIGATSLMIYLALSLVVAVCFYGFGPLSTSIPFILLVVGLLLGAVIILSLQGPIAQLFYGLFSKVKIDIKPKAKKKKKNLRVKKSAEPEEAIFIGIND